MGQYPFRLVLLVSLLGSVLIFPAQAGRTVEFAASAIPTAGSVVVTVAEGLPEKGSFRHFDTATGGALRHLAATQDFTGKLDTQLVLSGLAGFDRLLILGLGAQLPDQPMIETPWAHLDIAAMSWRSQGAPTVPEGTVGFGGRLLDRYVRDLE